MSEPFVFDPRHNLCKIPFGAVSCGETVTLRCRPLAAEGFTHCAVVLRGEFSGAERQIELSPDGREGERVRFSAEFAAPSEPDLLWYHFCLWRDDGSGCALDRSGYRADAPAEPWQLTVYEKTPTPQWFGEGISYQIFPDRFCRLSVPDPEGMVGDRWVHENWTDIPAWQPDPDGEVRNRDFFGGSLAGITFKLPYLADMGVTTLYLCPIFESASNHRYNTADYSKIDPMLGTEGDFRELCAKAGEYGIRVILDGVFNHTGSQSLYFNQDGFYPTLGAAQSQDSPYADWFSFHPWPTDYDAWWGIRTLPAVREESPSYVDYIIEAPDSVIRRWLSAGAGGWRLDVADELPDWFIEKIRAVMERDFPDAFLLGEVWEDASNKISYSRRRRYLLGRELHGVMNYPFRAALLSYLQGGDAALFQEAMETLRENYPPAAFYSAMNFLGTHDTPRVLTVLGADVRPESREARANYRLSPEELARGLARLRLAALVLFTFPGTPTVFYGDEAGMEGFEDPFNRGPYPWGGEDPELLSWFRKLGRLRREQPALRSGGLRWLYASGPLLAFARESEDGGLTTLVNASAYSCPLSLPWPETAAADLLTGRLFLPEGAALKLTLPPFTGMLLRPAPPADGAPAHPL